MVASVRPAVPIIAIYIQLITVMLALPHGALANLIQWQLRTSVCGPGDRTLQFAPISFDVSFQEIFTTFAQGGTLVLITDEDRLNSTQLLRKIIAQKINRGFMLFLLRVLRRCR